MSIKSRLLLLLFSLTSLPSAAVALPTPADGIGLIWGSAADIARPTALRINPAGLAFQPSWGLHFIHSDRGLPLQSSEQGDGDGLFVAFKPLPSLGLGLGLQLLYPGPIDPTTNERVGLHARLTLGAAWRVGRWLSIGANFHAFIASDDAVQQLGSFDLGLILRPWNWLSLGVMARRLNAPLFEGASRNFPRTWELALALRPLLDQRWILSFDVRLPENGAEIGFLYRSEFRLLRGFVFGLRASHTQTLSSLQIGAFLGFHFGNWGLHAYGEAGLAFANSGVTPSFGGFFASLWYSDTPYGNLSQPPGRMPMLDLAGGLPERSASLPFGNVRPVFLRVLQALDRVAHDRSVDGLMLRIGALTCGMAKVQELRAALKRIQKRGKKIVVYLTSASLKSYYLASMADKIYIYPSGSIQFAGLALRHIFFAKFLENIGAKAEFVKFGKYKTAPNRYTEKQMTAAQKESYKAILDDLFGQLIGGIARSRSGAMAKKKIDAKQVKAWMAKGWLTAEAAQKAGMVDGLLPWGEVMKRVHQKVGSHLWLDPGYFGRARVRKRWHGYDKIAVIHADGPIVSGSNLDDPIFGTRLTGAHTLIRYIIKAQYDSSVKAVVLRIDTPGGGVLASDLLWHHVRQLRRFKPVIVSMATVAASGGYYMAAPATEILAMPATLTGSIGIYAGKVSFAGLLQQLGVKVQYQKRGPMAGFFDPYFPFSAAQLKRMQVYIKAGYETFLKRVTTARKSLKMAKLRAIAGGRVWTGQRALKNGLVDRIGGLWDALGRARKLAQIPAGQKLQIVSWPDRANWRIAPQLALNLRAKSSTKLDPLARLFRSLNPQKKPLQTPLLAHVIQQGRALLRLVQKTKIWAIQPYLLYLP